MSPPVVNFAHHMLLQHCSTWPRSSIDASGLLPYQVASWSIQPFGHKRHGPKSGGCCAAFWEGDLGPYLTQCQLGGGLPPYQVASWSIQPFGHNRHGRKIGEKGLFPFGRGGGGGAGSPSNINVAWAKAYLHTKWHLDLSNCLATIHQCHRQTGQERQDRQQSNSIGQTFYKWSSKKCVHKSLL